MLADAAAWVAGIPERERELTLKTAQLKRLKDDKGEEIIKLQQLEGEKRARHAVERSLAKLTSAVSSTGITEITAEIKTSITEKVIEVGGARCQCDCDGDL